MKRDAAGKRLPSDEGTNRPRSDEAAGRATVREVDVHPGNAPTARPSDGIAPNRPSSAAQPERAASAIPSHIEAEFVTSLTQLRDFEGRGLPEVVLVGRSNVGKSSLINRVLQRNKLARTSSAPGMTRVMNVYRVQGALHIVDLPGYGYAKVSKEMKKDWGAMIESFLAGSGHIAHVLQIVDIRHEPSAQDVQMASWLHASGLPFTVVATKADKVGRDVRRYTMAIGRALAAQPWQIVPFSADSGVGRERIWELLQAVMADARAAEGERGADGEAIGDASQGIHPLPDPTEE